MAAREKRYEFRLLRVIFDKELPVLNGFHALVQFTAISNPIWHSSSGENENKM